MSLDDTVPSLQKRVLTGFVPWLMLAVHQLAPLPLVLESRRW
jgi:hypothetical protein